MEIIHPEKSARGNHRVVQMDGVRRPRSTFAHFRGLPESGIPALPYTGSEKPFDLLTCSYFESANVLHN